MMYLVITEKLTQEGKTLRKSWNGRSIESSDAEKQNRYDDRSFKMLEGKGLP